MRNFLGVLGKIRQAVPTLIEVARKPLAYSVFIRKPACGNFSKLKRWPISFFSVLDESPGSYKQVQQLAITLPLRFLNILNEHRWHPTMMSYTFSKPEDILAYRRTFDLPINFDADSYGIVFNSSDLKLKLPQLMWLNEFVHLDEWYTTPNHTSF